MYDSVGYQLDEVFEEIIKADSDANIVWAEDPVDFCTFNESPRYLDSFPLSERQYRDVINVIGTNPKKIFDPSRQYSLAVFVWGKGSGKDLTVSRLFTYVVYVLQCLKSPQSYLWEVDETQHMDIINVARKGEQAKEIFFSYFAETIKRAPWYKNNFIIKESNRILSRPFNKSRGVIDIGGSVIKFPKNINAYAETSAYESYEGHNIVLWCMDEASAFKSAAEVVNAYGIYKTLTTSGSTRATKHFKPLGFVVSYPRQSENDLTLDLYQISLKSSHIYGSMGWAWDIKPKHLYCGKIFKFSHPKIGNFLLGSETIATVEIPVELEGDFGTDKDIADAMCKHLCIPPYVLEQWVEYPDLFYNQLREDQDIFISEDIVTDVWDEESKKWEKRVEKNFLGLRLTPNEAHRKQFVMWLDAAEVFCDACLCIGHEEVRNGKEILVQDSNLVWTPDKIRNIKVSLLNVGKWVTSIIPGSINLVAAGSDFWNSASFAEDMKRSHSNVRTVQANLNREDYDLMKRFVYSGQTEFKFPSTVYQIVTLRRGTTKPIRATGMFQDQADGWTGVVKLLKGEGYAQALRLSSVPESVNISEAPVSTNVFASSQQSPFNPVEERAFEHRMVDRGSFADFRKYLGIPDHKPIRISKEGDKFSNRRLPLSTKI